ncbi:hypothetical protein V8E54_005197 [Elaphomyces granulatus]
MAPRRRSRRLGDKGCDNTDSNISSVSSQLDSGCGLLDEPDRTRSSSSLPTTPPGRTFSPSSNDDPGDDTDEDLAFHLITGEWTGPISVEPGLKNGGTSVRYDLQQYSVQAREIKESSPLRRIPAKTVRDQVRAAWRQPTIFMSRKSSYPKPYGNREQLFPPPNNLMELPMRSHSLYMCPPAEPGPARAIYDDSIGEVIGVIAHPQRDPTRAIWSWHKQLNSWVHKTARRDQVYLRNLVISWTFLFCC